MAIDMSGAKGAVKSDINVTPLVDVMLVLLIIMMIVAPLLQRGADVTLAQAVNTTEKPQTQAQTVVAVDKDDRFFVNSLPVRTEELPQKVGEALDARKERIILISADKDARYSAVMNAMDVLRASGIEDMGLITDPKSRVSLKGGGSN